MWRQKVMIATASCHMLPIWLMLWLGLLSQVARWEGPALARCLTATEKALVQPIFVLRHGMQVRDKYSVVCFSTLKNETWKQETIPLMNPGEKPTTYAKIKEKVHKLWKSSHLGTGHRTRPPQECLDINSLCLKCWDRLKKRKDKPRRQKELRHRELANNVMSVRCCKQPVSCASLHHSSPCHYSPVGWQCLRKISIAMQVLPRACDLKQLLLMSRKSFHSNFVEPYPAYILWGKIRRFPPRNLKQPAAIPTEHRAEIVSPISSGSSTHDEAIYIESNGEVEKGSTTLASGEVLEQQQQQQQKATAVSS